MKQSFATHALDVCLLALVTAGTAEVLHRRATSTDIPTSLPVSVVVLGFPSWSSGRPHPVQRWRIRLLLATVAKYQVDQIVFSGGSTARRSTSVVASEAATMAALAHQLDSSLPTIIIEDRATSTWENVFYSRPLIHPDHNIVFVSDPLHAARARTYWIQQSPSDRQRLYVTDCGRPLDGWWIKTPSVLAEVLRALKVRFVNQPMVDPVVKEPSGDGSESC